MVYLLAAGLCLFARERTIAQEPAPGVRIGTDEVMLDVVVRDKKGRPVRDLKAEELEVFEDGVRQSVTSFRLVQSADGIVEPGVASDSSKAIRNRIELDPSRQLHLVTMVFDNLDASGRRLARDAALDFIDHGLNANVMVSVFVVNNRFYVLQPFTNDREQLRRAIESATGKAERQFPEISKQIVQQLEILSQAGTFGPPAGAPAGAAGTVNGNTPTGMPSLGLAPTGVGMGGTGVDRAMAEITLSTMRTIESAQLDQRARASVYAFLHIARQLRAVSGRKNVLYFSNGLQIPTNLADALRTTISEANRANVSIYAIDARGLSTELDSDRARREMALAIKASRDSVALGGGALDRSALMSADFVENTVRMNKQGTLGELAESTGGFLIANTNDLRTPLRRVAGELTSYYLVSYQPLAREADGKFHAVTIRCSRKDLILQSRAGYFAVPAMDGNPVMAYEMPMLVALNRPAPPRDFSHLSGLLRFNSEGIEARHLLMIEVPVADIAFNASKTEYSAHISVLGLVRNEANQVVQRVSQDFPLQGKAGRLASLKKGKLEFSRPVMLMPGSYSLETVVHDFTAGKTSVERQKIFVPNSAPQLSLSSLIAVDRIEPGGASMPDAERPLVTPQGRIVPFLSSSLKADKVGTLSFYLAVHLAGAAKKAPELSLEFFRGGELIMKGAAPLPPPDERGRIFHFVGVPLKQIRSGEYDIRASVSLGETKAESTRHLAIENPTFDEKDAGKSLPLETPAVSAARTGDEKTVAANAPSAPAPSVITTAGISPDVEMASQALARMEKDDVQAASVNIADLLREVEANGQALFHSLLRFTYQHRKVFHTLNDDGRVISEEFQDYEAYPVQGRHVLVKIANMGKPLPAWQIEDERRRAGLELARAEQGSSSTSSENRATSKLFSYVTASINASANGRSAGIMIDPGAFLRACQFSDPRYESLNGRRMIALDFLPLAGADLSPTVSFLSRLKGTLWIDEIDRVLVRLEAYNLLPGVGKNGKLLPQSANPKLVYQQMRTGSGEWFPQAIRLNAAGDGSAFFGLNIDAIFEFKEYKLFNTTGEETRILPPEKKP